MSTLFLKCSLLLALKESQTKRNKSVLCVFFKTYVPQYVTVKSKKLIRHKRINGYIHFFSQNSNSSQSTSANLGCVRLLFQCHFLFHERRVMELKPIKKIAANLLFNLSYSLSKYLLVWALRLLPLLAV